MSRPRKRRGKGQRPDHSPRNHRGHVSRKTGSADDAARFWGNPADLPSARQAIHITDDPDATVRSLGPPPLPGHEEIAGHYFAAVYDRAVAIAGALAAVGGMIEPEELAGRDAG